MWSAPVCIENLMFMLVVGEKRRVGEGNEAESAGIFHQQSTHSGSLSKAAHRTVVCTGMNAIAVDKSRVSADISMRLSQNQRHHISSMQNIAPNELAHPQSLSFNAPYLHKYSPTISGNGVKNPRNNVTR